MPTTTFSGLASGIDSSALISSLMTVAKQPIVRLQDKQAANSTMSRKFTDFKTKLTALQNAAKALDTRSEAMVNKASSSDTAVVGVSTAGGASLGSFDITVTSAAHAERTYSNQFTSSSQSGLFGTGTLGIQVGAGATANIQIDSQDTLESVAGKINAAGVGVTAGIVFDGSQYRLQVNGSQTGTDNAITFTESTTTLGLNDPANEYQAATNAVLSIDNMPVTSQSNTITSAIPGVTLTIAGSGSASVTVDRDPDGLKTKLDAFVKAYNDVMNAMNAEFAYSGAQKTAGTLSGDSTLRSVQTTLRSTMTQGLSALTSSFGSVGSLGINIQRDGTLMLDADKLNAAVAKDYEGVTAALAGVGGTEGLMGQIVDNIDPFVNSEGAITNRINGLAEQNRDMDGEIARIQVRLDKYEEQLQTQYSALESLMSGLQSQGQALTSILKGSSSSS